MTTEGNVTRLEYQGKEIYLVGTAHVSKASVEEVWRVVRDVRPDTVCVELDQNRYDAMFDEDRWRKLDIFQVIKQKKVLFLLANLSLSAYQRRLGERFGVTPGAELRAAVDAAQEVGAELVLADRNIQATLKRSWAGLSFWGKLKAISLMTGVSFTAGEEITEEQIEALKDRDTITELMQQFAQEMPGLQIPLIDERDRYLMSAIQEAPGKRIVGVVGAGHVSGMVGYLGQDVDREAISVIPPSSWVVQMLKWVIPVGILCAFYFGASKTEGKGLQELLYAWILPNSIVAALFTAIAGGRLLTILTAFIASPITSLNPTIGAGVIAAPVEAWLRRPTVEDCEGVGEAIMTLKGAYGNRFTRVLLVFVGATLGSALGGYIGAFWVAKILLS